MVADPHELLEHDFASNRATSELQFEGPFIFYVELGSVLTMNLDHGISKARDALTEITRVAREHWHWALVERGIYEADKEGKTTLPSGLQATAKDWKRELWINFASGNDAMLSRITLIDLKGARHAECGGLSISS